MGFLWWVIPAAVAVFGGVFILSGGRHLIRGRVGRGTGHVVSGTMIGAIGLALSLVGLNMQLFSRLTHEGPVAEVSVKALKTATNTYEVTIKRLDGNIAAQTCTIQGDEWLIGGRVQKWKAWANVLGLDATYTLDQISNKYDTAARGNGKPITSCDLKGTAAAQDYVPGSWRAWLLSNFYTEDRHFGSANYMPLADGATYKVVITQAGFNAEPANDAAKAANDAPKP